MITSANLYCQQIIDVIEGHGVKTAFCSPGSRNAPLILALNSADAIQKIIVVDERSAAFQALGYSLVKKKPVLLVCTSGSAVLNYAPAIAEAYYAGVPLIVISADRPREWIDQDDSQTIRQHGVLGHIVKGSYDVRAIPEGFNREFSEEVMWTINRTVNEAMVKALEGKPGPVHINVQLSDPLGDTCEKTLNKERIVSFVSRSENLAKSELQQFASIASDAKILLVAGFLSPSHDLYSSVCKFASLPNVTVMAETISNLHAPQPLSCMIDSVLCEMNEDEKYSMRPDIVISIGGALVSRMLKQYLRDYPPKYHWSVGHNNYFCDCFKSLTDIVDVSPDKFLRQLYTAIRKAGLKNIPNYASEWLALRRNALYKSQIYIKQSPWSDLTAINYLLENLNLDNLFVSNGTVVRYSQLIPHHCHAEYCNRGVSGIDGCTATAVGGALAYSGHTTLITGDMSWIYDSGASTLQSTPYDMRIIVIDNSGGGIFRFIKSTSMLPQPILERYFCVGSLPDIASIAASYGIEVMEACDMNKLVEAVGWLEDDSDFPRLLVVHTPSDISSGTLKSYFSKLK